MVINDMTIEECREMLSRSGLSRLACEMDGQPYVVPVYLLYDGTSLFGFATMGYKIDCMRSNPLVSVAFDDIKSSNKWTSVVVFGRYEELPDSPEYQALRTKAHRLLQSRAMWWEPASVAVSDREYGECLAPIFYRINIDQITGRRATPTVGTSRSVKVASSSWLARLLMLLKWRT